MDLQERIRRTVEAGRAEIERQRQLDRAFDESWSRLNLGIVHATLSEAGKVIQDCRFGGAGVEHDNDDVLLRVNVSRPQPPVHNEYSLRLSPDRKALRVIISFTPKSLQDAVEERTEIVPLELVAIDRDLLETLCLAFVEGLQEEAARQARARR